MINVNLGQNQKMVQKVGDKIIGILFCWEKEKLILLRDKHTFESVTLFK